MKFWLPLRFCAEVMGFHASPSPSPAGGGGRWGVAGLQLEFRKAFPGIPPTTVSPSQPPSIFHQPSPPFITCPFVHLSVVKNLRSAFRWSEFASWLPSLGEL